MYRKRLLGKLRRSLHKCLNTEPYRSIQERLATVQSQVALAEPVRDTFWLSAAAGEVPATAIGGQAASDIIQRTARLQHQHGWQDHSRAMDHVHPGMSSITQWKKRRIEKNA
jgi:hypothetical protein